MPIYDFRCQDCGRVSELLLRGEEGQTARCSGCGSENLERLVSAPHMIRREAVSPGSTCCGRAERCDKPPCSIDDGCQRS
jgi:putative FmdB family regulatory protein